MEDASTDDRSVDRRPDYSLVSPPPLLFLRFIRHYRRVNMAKADNLRLPPGCSSRVLPGSNRVCSNQPPAGFDHPASLYPDHALDYRQAGIPYFPISWEVKDAIKVLLLLAVLLLGSSISLYFFSDSGLGMPYLVVASILGTLTVFATTRLVLTGISHDAWRVYKLTAFPYLGILFLTMVLDLWLL